MFRFTIRDVLWLMVVVGMGLGWWLDHRVVVHINDWWHDHIVQYHADNPNDFKRFFEQDRPPR